MSCELSSLSVPSLVQRYQALGTGNRAIAPSPKTLTSGKHLQHRAWGYSLPVSPDKQLISN
ncbi:hypothetical protein [Leptolyngbya sp. O-77]|uniref:hypothetical protein n=1 Tax=Leptolyngbya sp. O-77 TaxID=1080068 RepID=UPI0012E3C799|nr:hypothetical protein [Leptolyngbya sp. O-77]